MSSAHAAGVVTVAPERIAEAQLWVVRGLGLAEVIRGNGGGVVHDDGTGWRMVSSGTINLVGVWGSGFLA